MLIEFNPTALVADAHRNFSYYANMSNHSTQEFNLVVNAYVQAYWDLIRELYTRPDMSLEKYYEGISAFNSLNTSWANFMYAFKTSLTWERTISVPHDTTILIKLPDAQHPITWIIQYDESTVCDEQDQSLIQVPIGGLPVGTIILYHNQTIHI